jgi:hypothetical protein
MVYFPEQRQLNSLRQPIYNYRRQLLLKSEIKIATSSSTHQQTSLGKLDSRRTKCYYFFLKKNPTKFQGVPTIDDPWEIREQAFITEVLVRTTSHSSKRHNEVNMARNRGVFFTQLEMDDPNRNRLDWNAYSTGE